MVIGDRWSWYLVAELSNRWAAITLGLATHSSWFNFACLLFCNTSCLRSSSRGDLMIPCSQLSRYGSRSFAVCGPAPWNFLPAAIQDLSSSSSCFCSHLNWTFRRAYGINSPWHVCDSLAIRMGKHKLSDLLTYLPLGWALFHRMSWEFWRTTYDWCLSCHPADSVNVWCSDCGG